MRSQLTSGLTDNGADMAARTWQRTALLALLMTLVTIGLAAVASEVLLRVVYRDAGRRTLGGPGGQPFEHTFLDPENDPLGSGYHITQSKIAIGSGGLFGKGMGGGTQSALNFLPEKQTDFIFTTFVEEWGLVGALVLLGLFALALVWGFSIALRSQHHFGRLVALGVTAMMFLYVFINTAMVMGLLPVVGVPLPLVSNGGTAMVSVMFACGLLIGVNVYRDAQLPRTR